MKLNENLIKGREKYLEKIRSGEIEPAKQKNPTEKWLENKKSLRASINAFCWECVCESVYEIKHCTAENCPLYEVRPYQVKEND